MPSIPFALLALAVLLGCSLQSAMAAETAEAEHPLAVVDGQPVTEKDILPLIRGKLQQLRTQEYEIKEDAVQDTIDQRLLEKAAKAKGVSVEDLLQQEVLSKVAEPTDHEVESFYEAQKSRINRPLAEIKTQIEALLRSRKQAQAQSDYLQGLRAKADIKILLTPPRVQVGFDPARVLGNADAPVTIVEFSDYQCPFCKRALPVLKEILAKYPGKVRLAYRDFPLGSIHPRAEAAAEASRCAGEQGRFWPYHDLLFEQQTKLDDASLVGYARQLGLDAPRFEQCLKSHKYRAAVQQDLQKGEQLGISGTPAFFINGIPLMGARPLSSFTGIIDEELARRSTATTRQD
jgi:protein-disulfide isomerase